MKQNCYILYVSSTKTKYVFQAIQLPPVSHLGGYWKFWKRDNHIEVNLNVHVKNYDIATSTWQTDGQYVMTDIHCVQHQFQYTSPVGLGGE